MHEMALTQNVFEIIAEEARRQSFSRVRAVWLEIGALSCVEPEAMRFCFDAASRGTIADGALLEIIATDGAAWCLSCARTVPLAHRFDPCPECGDHQLRVTAGADLRVKELEVD